MKKLDVLCPEKIRKLPGGGWVSGTGKQKQWGGNYCSVSSKSTLSKLDYSQCNNAFLWDFLGYSRSPKLIGFWVLPTFSYLVPAVLTEAAEKSELHWWTCSYSSGPLKLLNLTNFCQWIQLLWHFTNHQEHIYTISEYFFPTRST